MDGVHFKEGSTMLCGANSQRGTLREQSVTSVEVNITAMEEKIPFRNWESGTNKWISHLLAYEEFTHVHGTLSFSRA